MDDLLARRFVRGMDADVYVACTCGCWYVWMLVCMKMSVESCSLSVLADGYKEKAKEERGKTFPPFIFMIYIASELETVQCWEKD